MKLKIAGVDPALNNTGVVLGSLDTETLQLDLDRCALIETDKAKGKQVRRNSDDFRRAHEIRGGLLTLLTGVDVVFAEFPSGTQSARGAMSNGIVLGVLTSIRQPMIQVMPTETKVAAVGRKDATKEEMINWATDLYPDLGWIKGRNGAKYSPRNEHCADACAIVCAGLRTVEFRDYLALYKRISQC